jgi:hypothetical protein
VISLGMSYAPAADPLALADASRTSAASPSMRRARDYHDTVKKALKALARWLVAEAGCELKVFVDTAPVMEKPLAEAAGLGWQGKHTNLVSRRTAAGCSSARSTRRSSWRELEPAPHRGPLRQLHRLPRRLPDQRLPGALPARCAALHLLPHDRA